MEQAGPQTDLMVRIAELECRAKFLGISLKAFAKSANVPFSTLLRYRDRPIDPGRAKSDEILRRLQAELNSREREAFIYLAKQLLPEAAARAALAALPAAPDQTTQVAA